MAVKASATITLSFMVDVSAVYRYYKLQASTASAPAVPTTNPPIGWTDAEPNYTTGSTNTLYTVDLTVFANNTFLYSTVCKSSSYEAAKEAYNKAVAAESAAEEAAKTATHYVTYVNGSLMISDMTDPERQLYGGATWQDLSTLTWQDIEGVQWSSFEIGKNVYIDSTGVHIRHNSTDLAAFTENAIEFDNPVTFTADGILLNNGDAYSHLGRNNILYSSSGMFVNADQPVPFSSNLSRQVSGAVFAWSYYNNGASQNTNWKYFFVPKTHVINHGGTGIYMSDPYLGMMKFLYVSNSGAAGVAANSLSGTMNGIAYNNAKYVLRYVIGV